MISELKDDEIMDFLMTSDFESEYKPEELKYLLYKWRYFYRLLQGNSERFKSDATFEIEKLQQKLDFSENKEQGLLIQITNKQNIIDSLKNRKLTYKERFSGKIILKDEDNRI